jgi:hypothetical protein
MTKEDSKRKKNYSNMKVIQLDPLGERLSDVGMTGGASRYKGTIGAKFRANKASATKTANEKIPTIKVLKEHGIKPLSKTGNYVKGKKIRIKEEYMKDGKPGFNKKSLSINIGTKSLKKYLGY